MKFTVLTEEEFASFAKNHDQESFLQTLELANLKRSGGIIVHFVGVKDNGKIVAASLLEESKVLFGKSSFYSPRGFLINYHDKHLLTYFTEELKKYVKKHHGFRVIIDPNLVYRVRASDGSILEDCPPDQESFDNLVSLGYQHFGFNLYFEAMQVRWAYRLKLDEPYESKKAKFSKSTKKNMEASYKKGLLVRKGTIDDLPVMEELFATTAKRKDFFFRDLAYYQRMYEHMHDLMTIYLAYLDPNVYLEHSKMLLEEEQKNQQEILKKMQSGMVGQKLKKAKETSNHLIQKYHEEVEKAEQFKKDYPNGRDIGCLLSLKSGKEYLTLTSGGLSEYHSFTPKYAMYDAHIQDAYKEGFESCNFYGISGNFEKENNPVYGVYEFKRGFGGNVIEYIGQFTLPVNKFNVVYNLLKKIFHRS